MAPKVTDIHKVTNEVPGGWGQAELAHLRDHLPSVEVSVSDYVQHTLPGLEGRVLPVNRLKPHLAKGISSLEPGVSPLLHLPPDCLELFHIAGVNRNILA